MDKVPKFYTRSMDMVWLQYNDFEIYTTKYKGESVATKLLK